MTTSDIAPNESTTLRSGVELELSFTDLLTNGQAVGRAGGLVLFCFGPLPGERARVRVTDVKAHYAVADLVELLEESPDRARPFCPVFGACGGCQLQHLTYPAQLRWKRNVVREALQRIGSFDSVDVRETIGASEPRAYRNKMSLVVDHRADLPAIGFYRQRSHEVVPIDACPIVTPKLNADLVQLASARRAVPVSAMLRDARHLVVRSTSAAQESLLTITTARRSKSSRRVARLLLRKFPGLAGVTNSFDLPNANAILGRRHEALGGKTQLDERIGGVVYSISPASFFQVNVEIVGRIFEYLEPWLKPARCMVDLYCGVGTFALFFARHGWRVHGVEENVHAIAEAEFNARRNALERSAVFTSGRIEQLVTTARLRTSLREADVLFLDPPRKGCDEITLGAIAEARVSTLWYLSCDPATLARDSKFLVAKGYRLRTVQPFDMFPQTGHIETLVHMEHA